VGLPTGEIYRHPVATKVINRRTRWWDRCAGRPGAWRNPGALGRGTVGAPVIVALAPRLKVVFVCHRARGCMLPGTLVLRAVGRLQSLHPHARRGNDAQGEHQQPKDPGGPRVGRSDHHDWDHRRTDANVQPNPPIPHGIPFDPTKILLRSPLGHRRSLLNTRAIRDRPLGTTSVSNSVTMRYRRHAPDGDFAADAALVAGSMAGDQRREEQVRADLVAGEGHHGLMGLGHHGIIHVLVRTVSSSATGYLNKSLSRNTLNLSGVVAEWFKAAVLKGESQLSHGVPLSPPPSLLP
jgi:hypothetical protein